MLKKYKFLILISLIASCSIFRIDKSELSFKSIPKHFPKPIYPANNQLTIDRVELGRKLFFDKILSRDRTVSCATCHKPELAFTDGLPKGVGIKNRIVSRNTPTLTNVAYQNLGMMHDQGVPTLEMQILVPVQEKKEFDFNLKLIATRLKSDSEYVDLCFKAYNQEPSSFVITRAISAFERTLISGNSNYDKFINGSKKALSVDELKGKELFFEILKCNSCHSGFNFTNLSLENNGLYTNPYPLDSGRMRITHLEKDRDLFKVPTLRNIEMTAPYMHDGSIKTLEEVIEHYSKGGQIHSNKSNKIDPFTITKKEKAQLILFLKSLTDLEFTSKKYE